MTALSDLIAKLEAAKRGNQKLGDKVLLACGWKTAPNFDRNNPRPYWIRPDGQNVATNRPNPTTSLDAALTLVPEGYGWCLYYDGSGHIAPLPEHGQILGDSGNDIDFEGASVALALCIAALKAREARR